MITEYKKVNFIEVALIASIILIPSIEYISVLLNGLKTTFVLITIWFIMYFFSKSNNLRILSKYSTALIALFLFVFSCFLHLVFNYNNEYGIQQLLNFCNYFFLTIISLYYSQSYNKKIKESIVFIVLIVLSVQAIISIPYLLNNDVLLIRQLASGSLEVNERMEAIKNGVGTNALYSSIPPFIVYSYVIIYKSDLRMSLKRILYCMLLPLFFSVLLSTFFASIMILILSILTYFVLSKNKSLFKIVLLGFSCFFIIYNFADKLDAFNPVIDKFNRFLKAGGDDTGRDNLANTSFNTFLDNPFWGIGVPPKYSYHLIGDHMPWIDLLASYGLVSFLFFLIFLIYFLRKNINMINIVKNDKIIVVSLVGSLMFIVINFISPILLNPLGYSFFIFFYLNYEND